MPSNPVTVMVPEPPPPPPPPPIASPLELPTVLFAWPNGPSSTTVTVTNDSDLERTVTEFSITGPGSARFSASLPPPQTLPVTLAPGETLAVRVTFTTPFTSGSVQATLRLRGETGDPVGADVPLIGMSTTGAGGEPSLAQLAAAYGLDDPSEVEIGDPSPTTYPLNATEPIPGNAQLVRTFVTADPSQAVVIQLLAMFVAPSAEDVAASWIAADNSTMDAFFDEPSGRRLLHGEMVTTGPPGAFRLHAAFEGTQVDSNSTLASRPQVLCWPIADSDADGKPDRWLVSFDDSGTLPTGSTQGRDFNDLVYVLGNAEAAS